MTLPSSGRLALGVALALALALLGLCGCDPSGPATAGDGDWMAPLAAPRLSVPRRRTPGSWLQQRARPTRLVRHGPAPRFPSEPDAPPGVVRTHYRSGKLELGAWLAVPDDLAPGERRPAVVYLHGWFGLRADAWEDARRFVEHGFVVMIPMLRGENGNPGEFEMFYGELDDASAAVRWLAARPEVDRRRVYAFGHSVGGGVAGLLSLVPDLPLVSTASVGGVYVRDVFASWRNIVPFDLDDPTEVKLRLLRPNLGQMKRPHHAYVGRRDAVLRYARRVVATARERHAPFTLDVVDGDHFSSVPQAIDEFIASVQAPAR